MDTKYKEDNAFLSRGFISEPESMQDNTLCYRGSCSKLDVFSWNDDLPVSPSNKVNIYEVRFKNSSKNYYKAPEGMVLKKGDIVAVEANPGHDIGVVSAVGNVAIMLMNRRGYTPESEQVRKIYRKLRNNDVEKWVTAVRREKTTLEQTKQIIEDLGLVMKLNDVEFQGDGNKAIFYYTAEDRVDFRELIKILADRFRIRIEMKQIGIRQEASRLGGIGSCGRELCCATWITKFTSVTTVCARVQQLSLNPVKLAGQCGKLKCCLNYEYDMYVDALKDFPDNSIVLKTQSGDAVFVKSDVFRKLMWYSYANSKDNSIMSIPISKVAEIIEMNKKGKFPPNIEDYAQEKEVMIEDDNVVTADDLTRFDD